MISLLEDSRRSRTDISFLRNTLEECTGVDGDGCSNAIFPNSVPAREVLQTQPFLLTATPMLTLLVSPWIMSSAMLSIFRSSLRKASRC